jgi:diguanylate cyclase
MSNSIGSRVIEALETAELAPTPVNYLRTYYALTGQTLGSSEIHEISLECLEVLAMAQDVLLLATDHTGTLASNLGQKNLSLADKIGRLRESRNKDTVLGLLSQVLTQARDIQSTVESSHRELMATRETIKLMRDELDQARILVHEDPLTGAQNRRGLNVILEQEIARAARGGVPLTVAMLDLDHFKRVNDDHGHAAGDQMLVHFANLIRSVMRKSDSLVRYGGEEFTLILPETDVRGAGFVLGRLQQLMSRTPLPYDGKRLNTTFSAGLATLRGMETPGQLLRRADDALYRAKNSGRNLIKADD